MKRIILFVSVIVLTALYAFTPANTPKPKRNFSEVYIVNGIEAYILSEPVRPYEVVYGGKKSINWTAFLTGGLFDKSIAGKVGKFIEKLVEKSEKEGKSFDAIIYTSGKNVTAVKFTDKPTEDTKQKAIVHRLNGIPAYVMCEPYREYRMTKNKKGGLKMKSLLTGGLINNSIEDDLMKFAKKFKKGYKKGDIDALLYTSGKRCDGIKFID